MSVAGSVDVSVEVFGGLVSNLAPVDLPHGVSPDCQDLQFTIGSVKTRPGVIALYTLTGSAFIQYMKTYMTLQETPRFLSLDSLGVLRKDVPPGSGLVTVYDGILPGSFCKSDSLFGREYFAFGNGTNGYDIPRQYDDTNFDRISQVGPAAAPLAVDGLSTIAIVAAPNGLLNRTAPYSGQTIASFAIDGFAGFQYVGGSNLISIIVPIGNFNASQIGDSVVLTGTNNGLGTYDGTYPVVGVPGDPIGLPNVIWLGAALGGANIFTGAGTINTQIVKIVTAAAIAPMAGQNVQVAAATAAAYDGTFPVRVIDDSTHFWVYMGTIAAAASSGGGTVGLVGHINAGVHQVSVIFVTRSGYYTKPSPPSSWTAAGGLAVYLSNIPIGPPNVVARIVCFTAASQASFYHLGPTGLTLPLSNMLIADNTTTSAVIDFSDQLLLEGTLDDPLFLQIELPPVAGIIGYSNRLFPWGEQGNLQNFLNLTFDGGFTGTAPAFPLGWVQDAVSAAGGDSANRLGLPVVFGDAYVITGDGLTAVRGKIAQSASTDYLANPVLLPNVAYGVRARLRSVGALQGTAHINLQSTSGGFTTAGIAAPFNTDSSPYNIWSATLTTALATIPDDLVLQVYVDGTPTNAAVFGIDNIEIYPLDQQYNNSNVRASKGQLDTQGQESFDSETGLIEYNLNDGQSVRSLFKIRERLYIVKEHSFGVTQDNGVDEPSLWPVDDVSKAVGTPSINGVGIGEDWVVIVHRTGLYLYWGGEVLKISEEIQPTWDSINWRYGYTISVTVDTRKRRILICAPFGESNKPNKTLVLDYHDVGSDAEAIAANPPIHLTYTGTKKAFDRSRKWCPWTIPANSIAQIELVNGKTGMYFGSNDGTGNINVLDDTGTVYSDNGAVIPGYYTMAFFVEQAQEMPLQLGSHRKLFTYLTMYVQGQGQAGVTVYLASLSNAVALNPQALVAAALQDTEMMLNQLIERMSVKISSSGAGNFFDLQRMTLNVKPDPWSPVRGTN